MLTQFLALGWSWEPSVLLGLAALSIGYGLAVGPLRGRFGQHLPTPPARIIAFCAATLFVLLVLVSPLDRLADRFLFSAHMLQHVVLTYIAPPLWLAGLPEWLAGWLVPGKAVRRILAMLTHPVPAFLIFNGAMWLGHIPGPYDAALAHPLVHVVEHLIFMGAALIGWWPVLGKTSISGQALSRPGRVLYLFASALPCTALSALITLSPILLYPFYGIMPLFWGVTPMLDQQLGGLIMWLPTDIIFAAMAAYTLYEWLGEPSGHHGLQEG